MQTKTQKRGMIKYKGWNIQIFHDVDTIKFFIRKKTISKGYRAMISFSSKFSSSITLPTKIKALREFSETVAIGVSSFSTALSIAKERIDYLTSNKKENPNVPKRKRC